MHASLAPAATIAAATRADTTIFPTRTSRIVRVRSGPRCSACAPLVLGRYGSAC